MNLTTMTEKQRLALRKKCLRNLFPFCVAVMGYDDLINSLHGDYCRFLESRWTRKQATMPRSFVKTWIGSIAYPIWSSLPREEEDEFPYDKAWEDRFWTLGPNMRTLIASYVIGNAEKMVGLIRKTYESNVAMQILFPEVIPYNFKKTKWNNQSACIQRPDDFTESTFEAAGIGGSSTSRHYDQILEDDLIYANKDDFTGQELQPSQEDIDKAIGWHKLAMSLLVPGKHTRIHNVGTRWAKHDLIDFIWKNEPDYKIFRRACVKLPDTVLAGNIPDTEMNWRDQEPEWSEAYDHEQLSRIQSAQGPYMFATQYLLLPSSPEELLFKPNWLQHYQYDSDLPKTMRIFTTIDVAEWDTAVANRKKGGCNSAVLTCGWCDKHHVWILHYDYGRFNPSEIIMIMAKHWKHYSPERIGVESVYYQKSLAHFAREYMQEGKVPWMTISQLTPENNKSKDLRIRGLEPLASNLAIHCKPTHSDFISEFSEYIPDNKLCRKDLLDCLAYQMQIARPGQPLPLDSRKRFEGNGMVVANADDLLEGFWNAERSFDLFGNPSVKKNPFGQTAEESDVEKILSEATNPYSDSHTEDFEFTWK
jgi:hypothetical protein